MRRFAAFSSNPNGNCTSASSGPATVSNSLAIASKTVRFKAQILGVQAQDVGEVVHHVSTSTERFVLGFKVRSVPGLVGSV